MTRCPNYRQQLFVEYYLSYQMNATKAYKLAYGDVSDESAARCGSRLLKNVQVKALIEQRISEVAMSTNEILMRLSEQARGLGGQFIKSDGSFDFQRMIEDGGSHLIQSVSVTNGGTRVEFYNAQIALIHLGKYHKLWDRGEVRNEIRISGLDEALRMAWPDETLALSVGSNGHHNGNS